MFTYSSPDRPRALRMLERSAERQAANAGISVSELLASEVAVYLHAIERDLAHLGDSADSYYRTIRERLGANANYVLEYRQDNVEASFSRELEELHAGLSRSRRARRLVDPAKLKVLLDDRSPHLPEVTADLVIAALHRVQIVAPLEGGVEALASDKDTIPVVSIGYGVSTLMLHAADLIVAYGMQETSPGISSPRNLRKFPEEYSRAVGELEAMIPWCESGARSELPRRQADAAYGQLVFSIAGHALSFVLFHELGHLLVVGESPYEVELACDEFAASILGSSADDRCWLGLEMAAQLLAIVLRMSGTDWRSANYPGASFRFSRTMRAAQLAGAQLAPEVDYLLAIPARVYEQQVFETDTRRLLFFSYAAELLARWRTRVDPQAVLLMALAVVDYATHLPTVLEYPEITSWNDESGQRAYVLTLEPYRALLVAGCVLADRVPQWERLAATAALLLITTVNHDPRPTDNAASLFLALARHEEGAPARDRASFDYLRTIGAIEQSPTWFARSTGTTVFYHQQAPSDGDIPVPGDSFAGKQVGAVMAAWHDYSSREDRKTPWHVQHGVKTLHDWLSD